MNDVKAVKKALSDGVSPNLIDAQGNSALALAITEKSIDVIKVLVDTPSIDLERPNFAGETPIMMMAYNDMYDLLVYLVDKRDVEINKPGWTALHYAATNGHERVASYLLDKYAYIDALSPNGTTPLMMAARGGHIHMVKLLLDRGADLSKRNGMKMTAIEFAEQNNQSEIAAGLKSRWSKLYGKPYTN
jgi:ankyrin repeat protein